MKLPYVGPNTATLSGSHGEREFDLKTGLLESPYGENVRLVRVDLREWRIAYGRDIAPGEHFDVLDLAGWDDRGVWLPPEHDWRDERFINDLMDVDFTIPLDAWSLYYLTFGREASLRYYKRREVRCLVEGGL